MAQKYTIQNFMPTGEEHETFGKEYHIKFAEDDGTFKLWYKTEPKEGQVQEGTVEGDRFKKFKQPYSAKTATPGAAPKKTYGAVEKDKQDGQRQGMCINNAANFVNRFADKLDAFPADEWAEAVFTYANALYKLGNLGEQLAVAQVEAPAEKAEVPGNVADIFGLNKPKEG
jgi:hypothetical protein